MKIHIAWVGPPEITKPSSQGVPFHQILSNGVLSLPLHKYRTLPQDFAGFMSLIESLIKFDTPNIELYFHCSEQFCALYASTAQIFFQNMKKKYPYSNAISTYSIVSFENSIAQFNRFDPELSKHLQHYLTFVTDQRIRNIRHRVNFRDLYNYCALYLYGGYCLDANIYAVDIERFSPPYQRKTLMRKIGTPIPTQNMSQLSLLNTTSLAQCIEPVLLINQEFLHSGQFQKPANEIGHTISKSPSGHYRMAKRTDAWNQSPNTFFHTDVLYDVYALRSPASTAELIFIIKYTLSQMIEHALAYLDEDFVNPVLCVQGYFYDSMSTILIAPLIYQLHCTPDHENTLSLLSRPHQNDLFIAVGDYEIEGGVFLNAPLVKFSARSYLPRPEYWESNIFLAEKSAVFEHIKPLAQNNLYQTARQLLKVSALPNVATLPAFLPSKQEA